MDLLPHWDGQDVTEAHLAGPSVELRKKVVRETDTVFVQYP